MWQKPHLVAFSFPKATRATMYVIYLDESGDPNGWNNNQDHFILGGLAIHEDWISRLGTALDDIQAAFFPDISIPLKLHA